MRKILVLVYITTRIKDADMGWRISQILIIKTWINKDKLLQIGFLAYKNGQKSKSFQNLKEILF